jgi:DNA replication initiation complex subunit (GINS family)
MPVEAFTYEDIYELLRTEKFSTDLENLKPQDLARIQAYLKTKESLLNKHVEDVTSMLSSQKKIKIQQEIGNAMRALKDLYEIRERKIINRAIYSVRTDSSFKDTTNLLETEIELYTQLLDVLKNQKEVFFKLLEKASEIEEKNLEISETAPTPGEPEYEAPESDTEDVGIKAENGDELRTDIKFINVCFTEECPEVFGEDLEKYGPFKPGDECTLPEQLCSILENQKKVERKQQTL